MAGSGAALDLLQRSRMLPNVLCHLERLSEKPTSSSSSSATMPTQRKIEPVAPGVGRTRKPRLQTSSSFRPRSSSDVIQNNALDWFASIGNQQVWPTSAILKVRFPFPKSRPRRSLITPQQVMINCVNAIATSPLRQTAGRRWTWRPARLVPFADLHKSLRKEVGGSPVLPLGHSDGKRTAALLVPNASFGGAEKVVYAAARELKRAGFETHLFVLGTQRMDVIDEFDPSFDYIHFWERGHSGLGRLGPFLGQDFIAEDHEVDWGALKGQLSGFDLIINNHVMAVHPLIARLRSEGTRTACYLHVVDNTVVQTAGRPALRSNRP